MDVELPDDYRIQNFLISVSLTMFINSFQLVVNAKELLTRFVPVMEVMMQLAYVS